jgi:hypothetical protein
MVKRLGGFAVMAVMGLLHSPWAAGRRAGKLLLT